MKANIHPQFFQATVTCGSCGTKFTLGSTQENIHVELCSKCHPFYTGQDRFVDSANQIEKFRERAKISEQIKKQLTQKKEEKKARDNAPKTLAEMLAAIK